MAQKFDDKVILFSGQLYVRDKILPVIQQTFPNAFSTEARCDATTAHLAQGCTAVVLFVNDMCDSKVIDVLVECGVKFIAMRCAGYDRVDLKAAEEKGIKITRVPSYSPTSVAEMAVSLMLALNRKIPQTWSRVRDGNYTLSALMGFEMRGKTVAVLGTGQIGYFAIEILRGFGCNVVAYDPYPNPNVQALGIPYMSLEEAVSQAHIISLHMPLLKDTYHVVNKDLIDKFKKGALLINVARGGLINTDAVIAGLKAGQIGGLAVDVYEGEDDLFFTDFTDLPMEKRMEKWDNRFALLKSFPNVLVCPHSAFFTAEALNNIAATTAGNLRDLITGAETKNEVKYTPAVEKR